MSNETRREREEALICRMETEPGYAHDDSALLISALRAAHRREDAIREIVRLEVVSPREKILAILDAEPTP